ncbi:MAG: [FeFe] hydrogenase H-cluster radical SAM maturase HydE, partial [Vallitaleaceae bacterium]|nr:[FeFe] hydrogenase H-cluster radical SAM maturase HydE [Vallitaleaceae bacterium]
MKKLIDQLFQNETLQREDLKLLLDSLHPLKTEREGDLLYLYQKADEKRNSIFGKRVFMRGLIEFSSFCKNDCNYCGIRKSNKAAERYRLNEEQILECCKMGYELGYRTFVLQGGEDPYFTDEKMVVLIKKIKESYPDCAITLSIGEKSYESYKKFYDAGVDRYLLRHETNSRALYEALHPDMEYDERLRCLRDLKEIGFQIGAGFMVGLPNQSHDDLINDLIYLKELEPHMVGIGPFIPHKDTPLHAESAGDKDLTCILLAMVRLLLPKALIPATTALGSIDSKGREQGIKAGANVVMPNLSPTDVRAKYLLYDGKICLGD